MEDLDMLQKIGLAFIAGLTAGQTIKVKEEAEREDEEVKVEVEKLEGKRAKEFMKFIEKITEEEK